MLELDGTRCLHDVEVNGLVFDAAFDGGNATRVEQARGGTTRWARSLFSSPLWER